MAKAKNYLSRKSGNCHSKHHREISVGCWNMQTLVEAEGRVETSVVRKSGRSVVVDRKAALMVHELKKYGVSIAGISETKWFGKDLYDVEGYMILHSGRPLPDDDSPMVRNEGVGIVLDREMTAAWREAGEVWEAVSSRIVCARLKLAGQGAGRSLDRRRDRPVYVTVVSVYAPTFRASVEQKEQFFSDLQAKLDDVNEHDVLLLVGDFNARVGSSVRCEEDPAWDGVRGLRGVGKMNEAGEALLSFCALNEMAIMNTYFQKKTSLKHTWQHPGSEICGVLDRSQAAQGKADVERTTEAKETCEEEEVCCV